MFELFVLGCTGVVVFIHGANFFFRALSHRLTARSLRYLPPMPLSSPSLSSWESLGGDRASIADSSSMRKIIID
ncbi:hypothetical protein MUK42_35759 [Musa troglodytarum]|uniref:Uncharacterized protein n=1 Tax=Musa troglodytarum TaxID=320322 RepID=A0A9E7FFV1_9LILI|nr:hypothetical protein MUK42_35759 [Musa troglodytarum]